MYNPVIVFYSKQLFDKLTPQEQAVLKTCTTETRGEQRRINRAQNLASLTSLKEKGMQINELPPSELARMRTSMQPLYDKATQTVGADMLEVVNSELKRVRGQ